MFKRKITYLNINMHYGPVTRAYFSTYDSTYEQFFKHVKVVIYKFCIRSKYARIRFDNV